MSEQKSMKRNLYKKKSSGQKLSTPKNLNTNLYPKILRRGISTKQSPKINLQKKTLQTLPKNSVLPKKSKEILYRKIGKSTQYSSYQRGPYQKKNQGTMDLNFKYDLSNQSFIQISVKLRFEVSSKLRLVESKFHRSFDETSTGRIEVSSKFGWNSDRINHILQKKTKI